MDSESEVILERFLSTIPTESTSSNVVSDIDIDLLFNYDSSNQNVNSSESSTALAKTHKLNLVRNEVSHSHHCISIIDRINDVSDLKMKLHEAMRKNDKAVNFIARCKARIKDMNASMISLKSYEKLKYEYEQLKVDSNHTINQMHIQNQNKWKTEMAKLKEAPKQTNINKAAQTKIKDLENKIYIIREKGIAEQTRLLEQIHQKDERVEQLTKANEMLKTKLDRLESDEQQKTKDIQTLKEANKVLVDHLEQLEKELENIKIKQMETKIENIKNDNLTEANNDQVLGTVEILTKENGMLQNEIQPLQEQIQIEEGTTDMLSMENQTMQDLNELELEIGEKEGIQDLMVEEYTLRNEVETLPLQFAENKTTYEIVEQEVEIGDDQIQMILKEVKEIPNVLTPLSAIVTGEEELSTTELVPVSENMEDRKENESEKHSNSTIHKNENTIWVESKPKMSLKVYEKFELEMMNTAPDQFRATAIEILNKCTQNSALVEDNGIGKIAREIGTQTDNTDLQMTTGQKMPMIQRNYFHKPSTPCRNIEDEILRYKGLNPITNNSEQRSIDSGYFRSDDESVLSSASFFSAIDENTIEETLKTIIPQSSSGIKRRRRCKSFANSTSTILETDNGKVDQNAPPVKRRKVLKSKEPKKGNVQEKTIELFGSDCESVESQPEKEVKPVRKQLKVEPPKLVPDIRKSPRLVSKAVQLIKSNPCRKLNNSLIPYVDINNVEIGNCCDIKKVATHNVAVSNSVAQSDQMESISVNTGAVKVNSSREEPLKQNVEVIVETNDVAQNINPATTAMEAIAEETMERSLEFTSNCQMLPTSLKSDNHVTAGNGCTCVSTKQEHSTDTEINDCLSHYLNFPYEVEAQRKIIQVLICQSPKFISRKIIHCALDEAFEKVEPIRYPGQLPMTIIQNTLFCLILRLERLKPGAVLKGFLREAEVIILSLKDTVKIAPIARLYSAVCKSQFYTSRMRMFIYDALLHMDDFAIPFIYQVAGSWIRIFPRKDDPYFNSILVRPAIEIIRLKNCKQPNYRLFPLRQLLFQNYGYSAENEDAATLLKELFDKFLEKQSDVLKAIIIVFCVNIKSSIAVKSINSCVKPLVCNSKNLGQMCAAIVLIGIVVRTLYKKEEKSCQQIINWLKEFRNVPCVETQQTIDEVLKQMPVSNN